MFQFIRCDERRPEWASACRSVRYAPLAESEALAVPGSEYVRYLGRTGGVGVLTCVATGDGSCFFPEVRLCVQEAAVSSTEEKETSSRTFAFIWRSRAHVAWSESRREQSAEGRPAYHGLRRSRRKPDRNLD